MMLTNISRGFVALIFASLIVMFIPAPLRAGTISKPSCCAHMQMTAKSGDCPAEHKGPQKSEQDTACCQACALGLALLFVAPPNFIYTQTGEESLVSLATRTASLPHRPPVPPPRTAIS